MDPTKGILITVDENTGLANRRAFQGHVEPLLKAAVRNVEKSLVVILNINNLDRIIVSESGIHSRADVQSIESAGVDAILVGTTLMQADDIGRKIDELMGHPSQGA